MAKGDIIPTNAAAAADEPEGDEDRPISQNKAQVGRAVSAGRPAPGYFTIYKQGQGKWTRLGTVLAAAALGILSAYNIYQAAQPYLPVDHPETARKLVLLGCVLFLVAFAALVYWLTNKPKNVDFLIATDSEMKKVNWTTKGELFGSTRVVVLFLVFIACFLFVVDIIFERFFHLIRVLQ